MRKIFIDSHAHVGDGAFDADRDAVLEASFAAGVEKIIEIGCAPQEWAPTLDLCAKYGGKIYGALGVHPQYADKFSEENFTFLKQLLKRPEIVAVGETGLDYFWEPFSGSVQAEVFERQLAAAVEINKPVSLHIRKARAEQDFAAYEDAFAILKNHSVRGVLHCFSGRREDAERALDAGLLLGINAIITYKKNDDLRATLRYAGLENIVLETDCPYLPPQARRGQRNTPQSVPEIGQFIADFLNVPVEDVARVTTENCKKIFMV